MGRAEIVATVYYFLIGFSAFATVLQVHLLRRAWSQADKILVEVATGRIRPGASLYARQHRRAEAYRLIQHLALFVILSMLLPIGELRIWERDHFWLYFAIETGGITLIPFMLLVTSLSVIRVDRQIQTMDPGLLHPTQEVSISESGASTMEEDGG